MNFDFSDDQKMLKDQARKFLSEKCTTKTVRAVFEGDTHHDAALWKQVAEMGWTGTAIPEEFGGLGLGYLELCVIAEESGPRACARAVLVHRLSLRRSAADRGNRRAEEAASAQGRVRRAHRNFARRRGSGRDPAEEHPRHAQGRQAQRQEDRGGRRPDRRLRRGAGADQRPAPASAACSSHWSISRGPA
ncbi:MAG: acyl-CoA dehydrogenase family protein [Rhizomicrobium sp.]